GRAGNSNMENTPSLAGQPALFLTNQMILMRDKLRASQVMVPFVQGLSDSEITALAEYYARLTPERTGEPIDAGLARRGAEIANTLYCASCHLPSYSGREQIPRLVPQRRDYLTETLRAYRDGRRSGINTSMNAVMYQISDQDIDALAHYIASRR